MTKVDKRILLQQMQEVGQKIGSNAVKDYMESWDIEEDDIQLSFYVKDTSKVRWKSKSQFIKIFNVELKRLVTKGKLGDIELLGLATRLSLQVNYEDNCILNDNGSYMTQKDIQVMAGWSKRKVTLALNDLIENQIIYIQKQEEDQRKNKYFMNPNIFYKGANIDKNVIEFYEQRKEDETEKE
jgi:hypothetical protein